MMNEKHKNIVCIVPVGYMKIVDVIRGSVQGVGRRIQIEKKEKDCNVGIYTRAH